MNIKVNLSGEPERIIKKMIKDGWATSYEEAIRMALLLFLLDMKRNHMFDP